MNNKKLEDLRDKEADKYRNEINRCLFADDDFKSGFSKAVELLQPAISVAHSSRAIVESILRQTSCIGMTLCHVDNNCPHCGLVFLLKHITTSLIEIGEIGE